MKVVLVRFREGERRDLQLSTDNTVVGRRPDCDLRIQTRDVSRRHCEISLTDDAVTVRDLGSSNGTFVNGKRVAEATLGPGDQLQVGPVVFVVQVDDKPAQIDPVASLPMTGIEDEAEAAAPTEGPGELSDMPESAEATITTPTTIDDDDDKVFELTADDFDLEDAISALDELDEDEDLP